MPSIALLGVFVYYAFAKNIIQTFFIVNSYGEVKNFVGFENYLYLFKDKYFVKSIGNTLFFVITTVPLSIFAGLILALIANKKQKTSFIYEVMYALPMATSLSVIAVIFQIALNPQLGIVNQLLGTSHNWP